jgi:hypothetical protein
MEDLKMKRVFKINDKVLSKKEFIKDMVEDLSLEYLFTSDILSNYLSEKNIKINDLDQDQVYFYTKEYVNENLKDMIEFITNNDSQVFNENKYTIEEVK